MREAIFGVLGSLPELGDGVDGATVADLFAGSGALGIEALSRGAARAVFVDSDRQATDTITANLTHLALLPSATVVRGDALRWLRSAAPTDVVFCDPPYAFDRWPELGSLLAPVAGVAVLETGAALDLGPGWEVLREKHYGGTVVVVARPVHRISGDRKGDR